MKIKLSSSDIGYISLFEKITGAVTIDCIADAYKNKIFFVVKAGDMGLAIGKKGKHIQQVSRSLGKKIGIIEYSKNPREFIKNVFHPLRVTDVHINEGGDKKVAKVGIDERDKISLFSRGNHNLSMAKLLSMRYHNISELTIV
jgi:N utilization substance protein A|tara:strand:- start:806 stop:1234 length:429 start_codon:yes stop_codon:yes gene_type:complete